MSKNITIQEGGVGKSLSSIKKIQTAKQGGGSVNWVPEDEVQLTTKHITSNGTYKASSDEAYGYSQVTVSGVGVTKGIDPITGNDAVAEINAETGEIEIRDVPSSIDIVTLPSKTSYIEGESIDISGIGVTAYMRDGTEWGDVSLSELSFEPTVAAVGESGKTGDLETSLVQPLKITPANTFLLDNINGWTPRAFFDRPSLVFWKNNDSSRFNNYQVIVFSETGGMCFIQYEGGGYGGVGSAESYTHNNKTVYYWQFFIIGSSGTVLYEPNNTVDVDNDDKIAQSAWVALYGEDAGGTQEITVTWNNEELKQPLTDTFDVTVDLASSDDDEGEGTGGGGGGSW